MTVFIDNVLRRLGRMVMCHSWVDTLDGLQEMAVRIGLELWWLLQLPKANAVHALQVPRQAREAA